jgi:hypothetical protein
LKNISAREAELILYLGSQIPKVLFDDEVGTHQIIESAAGYVKESIAEYVSSLAELPTEKEVSYLMGDFIDEKPILPLYCDIPTVHLGVSQHLESNVLHHQTGSLYLLERLELVKTLEHRKRYSSNPDFPEFVFSWLQFTPFGLEVYRHCVRTPVRKKRSRSARKSKPESQR